MGHARSKAPATWAFTEKVCQPPYTILPGKNREIYVLKYHLKSIIYQKKWNSQV